MKQKFLLIAVFCIGCTVVTFGQRKPAAKPVTTRPAQAASATSHSGSRPVSAIQHQNSGFVEMLPEFEKSGGKPFMDILRDRENVMNLQRDELQPETLSQILWSAYGTTSSNSHTAIQTVDNSGIAIYYLNEKGIFKYEPEMHELTSIRKGNFTNVLMNNNDNFPIDASSAFIFVYKRDEPASDGKILTDLEAGINCGAMMQNIALACSNLDLACIPIPFSDENKSKIINGINKPESVVIYGIAVGRK